MIVDFTGRHPNVYYEAGLADAWRQDWKVSGMSLKERITAPGSKRILTASGGGILGLRSVESRVKLEAGLVRRGTAVAAELSLAVPRLANPLSRLRSASHIPNVPSPDPRHRAHLGVADPSNLDARRSARVATLRPTIADPTR